MTAVSVEFSSPGKPVNFVPICHEVFAKTSEGVALYDSRHQVNATAVSKEIEAEQFNSLLFEFSELYCKLDIKISRNFYMGLEEEDKFKQFLYFFLFIERYTHYAFKNIDRDKSSKELMNIPIRLKESALELELLIKPKYLSLSQQFQWCSIFVWEDIVDEDIKKFKELKKIRDKISHGEDVNEVELPVGIARELASKLLKGSNHAAKS